MSEQAASLRYDMAKKITHTIRPKAAKLNIKSHAPSVTVEGPRPSRAGGEIWRLTMDGQTKTIVTSTSSTATMNLTASRYDKALKRLAKR